MHRVMDGTITVLVLNTWSETTSRNELEGGDLTTASGWWGGTQRACEY